MFNSPETCFKKNLSKFSTIKVNQVNRKWKMCTFNGKKNNLLKVATLLGTNRIIWGLGTGRFEFQKLLFLLCIHLKEIRSNIYWAYPMGHCGPNKGPAVAAGDSTYRQTSPYEHWRWEYWRWEHWRWEYRRVVRVLWQGEGRQRVWGCLQQGSLIIRWLLSRHTRTERREEAMWLSGEHSRPQAWRGPKRGTGYTEKCRTLTVPTSYFTHSFSAKH